MATNKVKSVWFCTNCGNESPKWMGKCPACGEWNTLVEKSVAAGPAKRQLSASVPGASHKPVPLRDVELSGEDRIPLGSAEMDRLLGGGIVKGSLVLIGGEPGIGKSTLSLQIPLMRPSLKTLYVTGEESVRQVKMRADRLGGDLSNCYIYSETLMDNVIAEAQEVAPDLMVVDSVQTMYCQSVESTAGSVSQIKETAAVLLRFGSTSELAVFEMTGTGLREVENPSEMLIPMHEDGLSGTAISAMLDGTRPFLFEVQALVSSAVYGTAQRSATGFDVRRLNMLLAVLERRAGFKLSQKDVFLNMAGGLKVTDPSCDLAVVVAVLSSNFDYPIPKDVCFAGEVGLSGEIRPVSQAERRVREAARLGFGRIFLSSYTRLDQKVEGIEVVKVADIPALVRSLFRS